MKTSTFLNNIKSKVEAANMIGIHIPANFICPITLEIMEHPMMTKTGLHFERTAIVEWILSGSDTCPMTRTPLRLKDIRTDLALKDKIDFWLWENHLYDETEYNHALLVSKKNKNQNQNNDDDDDDDDVSTMPIICCIQHPEQRHIVDRRKTLNNTIRTLFFNPRTATTSTPTPTPFLPQRTTRVNRAA